MTNLSTLIDAFVATRPASATAAGEAYRLSVWAELLGDRDVLSITADDVDEALIAITARGNRITGAPLAPSTINRFITTLGSVFKFAKANRRVPRAFVAPTRGIEKAPEPVDPNKYFRPEEVERLVKVARVTDMHWGKLAAFILLAFHTGLRRGNILNLKWGAIDWETATVTVSKTKNGSAVIAPLTAAVIAELKALPLGKANEFIFSGRHGNRPVDIRSPWRRACEEAGFAGRTPHWLRHGCGSALANAGVSQAQVMAVLGHKSLVSSSRYMHHNVEDKRRVVDSVFG